MDYSKLKGIFSEKVFYKLHSLINKPTLQIYVLDYTNVENSMSGMSDPFDNPTVDMTTVSSDAMRLLKEVDCIYAYEKSILAEDDQSLGTINSLTVFMRFDDVPKEALDSKASVIIKFNGVQYKDVDLINMYDIIIQSNIKL
jgi:hypothetical protein